MNMTDLKKEEIAIGSDHAGYSLKEEIKYRFSKKGYKFRDFGAASKMSVDYPDIIHPLAKSVNDGQFKFGIILCGSGNGVAITANKYVNVRAALCWEKKIAVYARLHNDANILAIPARFMRTKKALEMVESFLNTSFENGRHSVRVEKISNVLK